MKMTCTDLYDEWKVKKGHKSILNKSPKIDLFM